YQKGIELISAIPGERQRNSLELLLRSGLATALLATRGYADPVVSKSFNRSNEIALHMRSHPQLPFILSGLWTHYTAIGKHAAAFAIAKRLEGIAKRTRNPLIMLEASKALGGNFFWRGELIAAEKIFSKVQKNLSDDLKFSAADLSAEHPAV